MPSPPRKMELSPVDGLLRQHGIAKREDGSVNWIWGTKEHPRNWPKARKLYDTAIVVLFEFITGATGTAGVAASEKASQEMGLNPTTSLFCFTSIYLIGQGLGGIGFPPYSESFGRKKLYVYSTALYAIFCVLIGAVHSLGAVIVGRFFCGLISAIPTSVSAGSIEDLFNEEARIWAMFFWVLVANVGLLIGTVFGTYIAFGIGWRWIFYIAAAATGLTACLFIGIRESRPSKLLVERLDIIRAAYPDQDLHYENPDHAPSFRVFVQTSFFRPIKLFWTEPIVFIVTLMTSVAFGLIYLFTEALQIVYSLYGLSIQETSLAFLPITVGLFFSIIIRVYEIRLYTKKKQLGEIVSPEEKLAGYVVASPVLAIGLWWFSWTIPPKVTNIPWICSMLALVLVGFSFNEFDNVLANYMADSYTLYSASAFASLAIFRSGLSAATPLFGRQMFIGLGENYAGTTLAAVATVACISPIILVKRGAAIRQRSKFACHSASLNERHRVD